MNIFTTSQDPVECAKALDDRRVIKMILESAQLLSTAVRVLSSNAGISSTMIDQLYKQTHTNHPCNVWVRESYGNYEWLRAHLDALLAEYTHRYGKRHKTSLISIVLDQIDIYALYDKHELTPFVNCTPFKTKPTLDAYKLTMCVKWADDDARGLGAKWTNRTPPEWRDTIMGDTSHD